MAQEQHRHPVAGIGASRLLAVALVLALAAALCCSLWLIVRHGQERSGAGAVESPAFPQVAYAGSLPPSGRFRAELSYTCYGAPRGGEVSSSVLWDDAWFFSDARSYNHELARASIVLATLAYSESSYYQGGSDTPPYMEDALAELGFTEVDTSSYRYRSEVVDELIDVVTQESDGVAYTIARKGLGAAAPDRDDAPRELIMVSVRGSYGSEWLSNFNLRPGVADDAAELLAGERARDHSGYQRAAMDILADLDPLIRDAREAGHDVSILLCGHSRGGAVAGLLAAMLDDRAAEGGGDGMCAVDPADIYAYTFASPRTTASDRGNDARYGNIFNIVNPADMVGRVPLEAWGYTRYGVDLELPAVDDEGFDALHARMDEEFLRLTGERSSYDPAAKLAIDAVVDELGRTVPTVDELMTPGGIASVAAACALRINPATILLGHYPSVYIAWMEALPTL